jgi:lysophospholipase L1-like esterase
VLSTPDSTGECELTLDATGAPVLQAHWQAMLTGMKAGDWLFIQFGINDSSPTCNRHVGLAAFKQSYAMMAQAARARGAHPVFITPLSAIACTGTTAHGTRGAYVTATKEAGVENGVKVIDLHQLSVDLYNASGFCPIPGGGDVSDTTTGPVGDFFCADHTHLEDAGAVRIAGLVANALRNQGIGLAAFLR